MSFMDDSRFKERFNESNTIFIDGNEEELVPGLNALMSRVTQLYIDNYMDQEYIDSLSEDETVLIDFTTLSMEEMRELINCAVVSLSLEADPEGSELLLS